MAVAGAGLPLGLRGADGAATGPAAAQLQGPFFKAHFDLATGQLRVWRGNGTPFLVGVNARAVLAAGARSTGEDDYARTVEVIKAADSLGAGQQLIARCVDRRQQLDFELQVTVYEQREALVVEALCRNASDAGPLVVRSLEPVRALPGGGGCLWPGVDKTLSNGLMYYDPGKVRDFSGGEPTKSWWNIAFYSGERKEGLVVGYLENRVALGRLTASSAQLETEAGAVAAFSLLVESEYEREFVLRPGARVSSDRVGFIVGSNPFAALESYAQAIRDSHKVRLNPPVNGWCSWFSFYGAITEAEVVRQAEFTARRLKPYGCDTIQLDDGFYRAFGDWEGNAKFPHGMKWLAQKIRSLGLRPGIWLAPYVIAEGAGVHQTHPEWLLRNPDGSVKQIGSPQAQPRLYALDITHPGAAEWLRQLFKTAADDWGYDMFKIDFVEWSLLAAERYHDPTVTKAAAYRRGFEIMREAIGPQRHLLDCGPGNTTVGLLDSMRIELDQPPLNWRQYFLTSASSAPAAAKRYYFHGRAWVNDVDHVGLGYLTPPQAQAVATLIGLSGGNTIAGDRLTDLDATRLAILQKVFPSSGEAARPVDLFESDRPEVFALPLKRRFGEWLVLALFNADETAPAEKTLGLERLGLDPAKTYVAFDFWNQRLFGEVRGLLRARVEPSAVLLLSLHEKREAPQFISTDRHVTQGAVELEDVGWDAAAGKLQGVSLGAPGTDHSVFIYLPRKHPWRQRDPFFFYDFPGYTLQLPAEQILRIRVHFDQSGRVPWEVNLTTFLRLQ
jgi:alpha-galactosidase